MIENRTENEEIIKEEIQEEEPKFFQSIIDFQQRLAEFGRIKIGEKGREKTGKGSQPKWFEHFLITKLQGDSTKNFLPNKQIMDSICPNWDNPDPMKRKEIKDLDIILPFDDPDLNFIHWMQSYDSQEFICQGNGRKAWRREGHLRKKCEKGQHIWEITGDTRNLIRCNPQSCPLMMNGLCGITAKLGVFLPQMDYLGGVFAFRTGSWETYMNIRSSLYYMHNEVTHGLLAELKCRLSIRLKMKQTPYGMQNLPVVNLYYPGSRKELRDWAAEIAKERQKNYLTIETFEAIRKRRLQKIEMSQNIEETAAMAEEFAAELEEKITEPVLKQDLKEKTPKKQKENLPQEEDTKKDEDKRYCHLCGSEEINGGWCSNESCSEYTKHQKKEKLDDVQKNSEENGKNSATLNEKQTSNISTPEQEEKSNVDTKESKNEEKKPANVVTLKDEIEAMFQILNYKEKEIKFMVKKYGGNDEKLAKDLQEAVELQKSKVKNSYKKELDTDTENVNFDTMYNGERLFP